MDCAEKLPKVSVENKNIFTTTTPRKKLKLLLARQPKITPNSYIPVIHYHVLEMRLINKNCIGLLTCVTGRIHCKVYCTGAFFTRSRFKEKKFVNYL